MLDKKRGRGKPFEKGHNGFKPKGAVNKVTKDIREAFKNLIEDNLENMTIWVKQIAADDPAKAMVILQGMAEFILPKLARTELTGKDGQQLEIKHEITPEQAKLLNSLTE